MLAFRGDPIVPAEPSPVTITLDGTTLTGALGQSIAGVILGSGTLAFRLTSVAGRPRGVFCGIGVCYDCLVEVNGHRDIRGCQRRAIEGDVVVTQHDPLPANHQAASDQQASSERTTGDKGLVPGGTL
ncbi:MAG: (2Fe-2S)-binding protein [Microbacteriaceae bacterium]